MLYLDTQVFFVTQMTLPYIQLARKPFHKSTQKEKEKSTFVTISSI